MTASLPKAKFVGVDYSLVKIKAARKVRKIIELSNIEFRHEDLCEFDTAKLCKFDYVIAHGIYSWLPAQAQSAANNLLSRFTVISVLPIFPVKDWEKSATQIQLNLLKR